MSMTYAQLERVISEMTDKEKQQDVTIYSVNDAEYYPAQYIKINTVNDVLDEGHYYIEHF